MKIETIIIICAHLFIIAMGVTLVYLFYKNVSKKTILEKILKLTHRAIEMETINANDVCKYGARIKDTLKYQKIELYISWCALKITILEIVLDWIKKW